MNKYFLNSLKKVISKFSFYSFKLLNSNHQISFFSSIIKGLERSSNSFITYCERAVIPSNINNITIDPVNKKLAIVIQGPIKKDNHFTFETVKWYQNIFPNSRIVVSTWKDEDLKEVELLKSLGIKVLLNNKPEISGMGNMNFQVKSTLEGIKWAEQIGCEYVIKTRTDQRIYKENLFQYLLSLQSCFPVDKIYSTLNQQERIIMFEGNVPGNMFIPFHFCDFFYFGKLKDIFSYFSKQWDNTTNWLNNSERGQQMRKFKERNLPISKAHSIAAPEVILNRNYLKNNGVSTDIFSLEDSWAYAKSHLVIVGWEDLGLFWYKYDKNYNESYLRNTQRNDEKTNIYRYTWNFVNWMAVYGKQLKPTEEMKNYCKKGLNDV